MRELGKGAEILPDVARRLNGAGASGRTIALAAADEATLDGLFARYTMERERARTATSCARSALRRRSRRRPRRRWMRMTDWSCSSA
jgi:hypothetical protein